MSDDRLDALENEYCPPIDIPTFRAIASDFDLDDADGLASARNILDSIRADAEDEETLAFDPTGSHLPDDRIELSESSIGHSRATRTESQGGASSDAPLRSSSSGLNLEPELPQSLTSPTAAVEYDDEIESMPFEDKEALLKALMLSLRPFDVSFTLKKCNGNFGRALDDLLNQAYLQELSASDLVGGVGSARGIDGFLTEATRGSSRHKRQRRTKKASAAASASSSVASLDGAAGGSVESFGSSKSLATALTPQYLRPVSTAEYVEREACRPLRSLPSAQAARYEATRSAAFAQAAAAYRKSKSNPLMAGAAAYYASVGREAHVQMAAANAAAAEELVARQSSSQQLDLHGVSVGDAVRISKSRLLDWWEASAGEWARAGRAQGGQGYRIVVGVGRHNNAGRSVIGPAVKKALREDGWRVDDGESGVLTVLGRNRR